MSAARLLALVLALAGCAGTRTEAAPRDRTPSIDVSPVAADALCVTHGELANGAVAVPTLRGVALGASGDAAQLTFTYRGESADSRALASGDLRRQIGLKLRAQNSCNVIYVMWRLPDRPGAPPKLDVSVKRNPRATTHEDCGAHGYTKVRPYKKIPALAFERGTTHTLRAEIVGDELSAWIDGTLRWQGRLPDEARSLTGPAGLRSDNVQFDLVELAAPAHDGARPACKKDRGD